VYWFLFARRISPKRNRISARRGAGVRRHLVAADFAASTALLTSSAFEAGKRPMTSEVSAGLRFSNHSPEADFTHSPPM